VVAAAAVFQGEERPAVGLAGLVDLHDVGVLQAGDRLRLRPEAPHLVVAGVAAGQQHLERHFPPRALLPGVVDDADAAAPEFAEDLVAGHGRPRRCRRGGKAGHRRNGGGRDGRRQRGVVGATPRRVVDWLAHDRFPRELATEDTESTEKKKKHAPTGFRH
jgi:hypothetical protein